MRLYSEDQQQYAVNGSFVSHFAPLLISLVCEPPSNMLGIRQKVIKVLRSVPRSVTIYGLRQYHANRHSKSKMWGSMFSKKSSSSGSSNKLFRSGSSTDESPGTGASSPTPTPFFQQNEENLAPMASFLKPLYRLYDRSNSMQEKLSVIEVLAMVTFADDEDDVDSTCTTKTQGLICDFLKNANANASTELSAVVSKHTHLFVPHVWVMMASSVKSKSIANKWLAFLRKYYQPDFAKRPVHPMSEVMAAVRGISAVCASANNNVDPHLVYRLLGVVYEVSISVNPTEKLFSDCVTVSQTVAIALAEGSSSTSESKETALLLIIHLLGKWAYKVSPANTTWIGPLRAVLDQYPYGVGRCAWRVLQQFCGTLLF